MRLQLLTFLLLLAPLSAQGSRVDYARAAGLHRATADKLFRADVRPQWLADGRFWYRVRTAPSSFEWILIDPVEATRAPLFDQGWLAEALGEALGLELSSENLDLRRLDVGGKTLRFSAHERRWACRLPRGRLRELEGEAVWESLPLAASGARTRRTGPDSGVRFVNRRQSAVEVFWVDFDGQSQSYGQVAAGAERQQHTFGGHVWRVLDADGALLGVFEARDEPADIVLDAGLPREAAPEPEPALRRDTSPDGRWRVVIRAHNAWLRDLQSGDERQLSDDGSEQDRYTGEIFWAPNSSRVVVLQVLQGARRQVHLIESSPTDQLQPRLHSLDYTKPGDRIDHPRPRLFLADEARQIEVAEQLFPQPWSINRLRWLPDSSAFSFFYNQRGHQHLRLLEIDAQSGVVRAVIDERSETFLDYAGKLFLEELDGTGEAIWMSERDGWNHLYLIDREGARARQITRGAWVVRSVEWVDPEQRQVWFAAGGIRPEQDPYHLHLCRVDFDGRNLEVLTDGDGTHEWELSPDRRWLLDSWSRVDLPPVHVLRDTRDGSLVCELETADASALLASGWTPPERFVAAGRDGETPIWGIVIRPSNFEPGTRYPVIEKIYAGPHSAHVPKAFGRQLQARSLAELGFVVVQIDGMGTSQRSKAFHDVCWKNLADAGFPDRVAWLKAAGAKFPELDLERVGIYGGSAGGQNTLAGMLSYPEVYKVGVADCGCHDNRMDKIWWNELWMGWPVGAEYEAASNVSRAEQLQGKLLLVVGELDRNVDPASTMQVVAALIAADKDFELLVMPGVGHGAAETPYGSRRRQDFFVRNLLGREPRWQP